jgi:hypothetical protein
MGDFLPWLFIIVASAGMVAGLVSLWLSLSLALSDEVLGGARAALISDARLTSGRFFTSWTRVSSPLEVKPRP